jgi:peptidoglycan/xylan/chitin deacetylase (PgdA/CDA1 family)
MHVLSLEYHDVVAGEDFDASGFPGSAPASYKLTADAFDAHLDAIGRANRPPVGVADAWFLAPAGQPPLFITFDDGGAGSLVAADLLERRGWRGHFFVTAGRVDTKGFLTRDEIVELHRRGHVIGSHSFSHPTRMGAEPAERILEEWRSSQHVLSDILGAPVVSASVPGGFYRPVVAEMAAQAGVRILFTSMPTTRCSVVDGCHVLGRYTLRRWSTPRTAASLAAGGSARAGQWMLYSGLHLIRLLCGERYTRIRQRFWSHRA